MDDDKLPEHLPTPRNGPVDSRQVLTENEALDCNPTSGESPGVEQTLLEEYMINETTYESLGVPFVKRRREHSPDHASIDVVHKVTSRCITGNSEKEPLSGFGPTRHFG